METKTYIYIGIFLGGALGGWIGAALDHGNYFGLWSILLGTIGSLVGIWVGMRFGES